MSFDPSRDRPTVLALIDKTFPDEHSFIDGMLATEYPKSTHTRTLIAYSRRNGRRVARRSGAVALNVLTPRRGWRRVLSPFSSYAIVRAVASRRREHIVIFVRNDPFLLLGALVARRAIDRITVQISFPHENYHPSSFLRLVTRTLYQLLLPLSDAILVVSQRAKRRISAYAPEVPVYVLPLAADALVLDIERDYEPRDSLRLLYVGSHRPDRQLGVVLRGCARALDRGVPIAARFIGGSPTDIHLIRNDRIVDRLIDRNALELIGPLRRTGLRDHFRWADIGLSTIPVYEAFREASPTKLAEYMGAGLMVIASEGIEYQDETIRRSRGGILVRFDEDSIADGLCLAWRDRTQLAQTQQRARAYAVNELSYQRLLPILVEALGMAASSLQQH